MRKLEKIKISLGISHLELLERLKAQKLFSLRFLLLEQLVALKCQSMLKFEKFHIAQLTQRHIATKLHQTTFRVDMLASEISTQSDTCSTNCSLSRVASSKLDRCSLRDICRQVSVIVQRL